MKHANLSKAQRQYVRGVIHNLSLQRWTGSEIADYLNKEKDIQISSSSVGAIRNTVEKEAEKWYLELKQSSYKYIATYKERLDALFSLQKQLHEIVTTTKRDDIKIRALATIASIEMDIFTIWKQLPELDIVDKVKQLQHEHDQEQQDSISPLDEEGINGIEQEPSNPWHEYYQCNCCKRWWRNEKLRDHHKKSCILNVESQVWTDSVA